MIFSGQPCITNAIHNFFLEHPVYNAGCWLQQRIKTLIILAMFLTQYSKSARMERPCVQIRHKIAILCCCPVGIGDASYQQFPGYGFCTACPPMHQPTPNKPTQLDFLCPLRSPVVIFWTLKSVSFAISTSRCLPTHMRYFLKPWN